MGNLTRFGVSAEDDLLESFDRLAEQRGYQNRSEALRDLMRDALVRARAHRGRGGEGRRARWFTYRKERAEMKIRCLVVSLVAALLAVALLPVCSAVVIAQEKSPRLLSGVVVTSHNEAVVGATVTARYPSGEQSVTSDRAGQFTLAVPFEPVTLTVTGKNISPSEIRLNPDELAAPQRIEISYVIPPLHDSLVIMAGQPDPVIDRRNAAIFRDTLFSRDDQVFHTLDAGINAGQHEGGGKSLEIRRFGFNLDHGGVSGGLKVLVDNVQQNQSTQGHGQGYLGQLKSLTPELIAEAHVLNGPFSAEYGDFSGLGVVHIRLKESLPDVLTRVARSIQNAPSSATARSSIRARPSSPTKARARTGRS
jgi:hypothetical protein